MNNFSPIEQHEWAKGMKQGDERIGKGPFLPTKGKIRKQGLRLHLGQVYRCPIAVPVSRFIKTAVALPLSLPI